MIFIIFILLGLNTTINCLATEKSNVKQTINFFTDTSKSIKNEKKNPFGKNFKEWFFDETYKDDANFKRHIIDVELGVLNIVYNDIANGIGSYASRFSSTAIENRPEFYSRYSYYFNLDRKNSFRLLVAPLTVNGAGIIDPNSAATINYDNIIWNANQLINYEYKFNSYRATYRRTIFDNDKFTFMIGFTAKIRDARILINQNGLVSNDVNVGFVPLLYFNFEYRPIDKLTLGIEGDVTGAPQGSAVDVDVFARYRVHKHVELAAVYRFLFGGVSIATNYNYGFYNYFGAAIRVSF
jgi:hypothetical protein